MIRGPFGSQESRPGARQLVVVENVWAGDGQANLDDGMPTYTRRIHIEDVVHVGVVGARDVNHVVLPSCCCDDVVRSPCGPMPRLGGSAGGRSDASLVAHEHRVPRPRAPGGARGRGDRRCTFYLPQRVGRTCSTLFRMFRKWFSSRKRWTNDTEVISLHLGGTMKVRIDHPSHRSARPVSVRIKTGVRAGGDLIMPNHNSTRGMSATRKARPAAVRIKTGVRAGGDVVMPNHNGTRGTSATRKARPAAVRIKTGVRAGGDVIMPNHNVTRVTAG